MGFDRFDAKMRAKESMRQNRPSPLLVTLVYLLLTTGLSWLIGRLVFDPSTFIMEYSQWGYSMEEILEYLYQEYMGEMMVAAGVGMVFSLYSNVMGFGYISYTLRMARNEQPGYSHLLDGFYKLGRVLWVNILQGLFVLLWTLPFLAVAVLGVWVDGGLGVLLMIVGYFGCIAITVIKALSYSLSRYFLLDDPACTARQAITRSKEAMQGKKGTLLVLGLSFIGWDLLAGVTMGIANVWVLPYREATTANFYDYATGNEPPKPAQEMGDYHYRMTDM